MIRGLYTALSGMVASMTRQSVVADDVANVNTPGFKQGRTSQADFELALVRSAAAGANLGPLGSGTLGVGLTLDRAQGPLETTGNPTDLAIEGDGLFVVRTVGGTAYTRAGDFVLDGSRTLVTQEGQPVLDTAGRPIVVPAGSEFSVGPDGTVAGTGQRLALVAWPAGGLSRLGQNLYTAAAALPPAGGEIRQGSLERSNVDMAGAMTDLIRFQRSFAMDARALSIQDGTLGDASQLGRIR